MANYKVLFQCYVQLVLSSTFFILTTGQYQKVNVSGDILLGAMFGVHNIGEGDSCGVGISEQIGLQNLEAFLFALDKVNNEILNKTGKVLMVD